MKTQLHKYFIPLFVLQIRHWFSFGDQASRQHKLYHSCFNICVTLGNRKESSTCSQFRNQIQFLLPPALFWLISFQITTCSTYLHVRPFLWFPSHFSRRCYLQDGDGYPVARLLYQINPLAAPTEPPTRLTIQVPPTFKHNGKPLQITSSAPPQRPGCSGRGGGQAPRPRRHRDSPAGNAGDGRK